MKIVGREESEQIDEEMIRQQNNQGYVVVHPSGETYVPSESQGDSGLVPKADGRLEIPDISKVPVGEKDLIGAVHDFCDITDEIVDIVFKRGRRHFSALTPDREEALTEALVLTKAFANAGGYLTRGIHHCGKLRRAVNQTYMRVKGRAKGEVGKKEIQMYDQLYKQWRTLFYDPFTAYLKGELGEDKFDKAMKDVKGNKKIWETAIGESFGWVLENWKVDEQEALRLSTNMLIDAYADKVADKSSLIDVLKDGDIAPAVIRKEDRERAKRAKELRLPKSAVKDLKPKIERKKKAKKTKREGE